MKLALSLALCLLSIPVRSGDVPLAWDCPTNDLSGFVLYASTLPLNATNLQSATVKLPLPPVTTVTLKDVRPGFWWIAVTAICTNSLESAPSNVLIAEVPVPPSNLRTVVLQYGATVTNWQDVGFFKVKLGP